mgnify:CR=1 FL=1
MVDPPRIGTARSELEVRLGTERLPLEVRLDDVEELERLGRANDAPELLPEVGRELLEVREEVLEDERELGFDGALATEVL